MFALFTMLKAFRGDFGVIQRNAILSWTRIHRQPEIILFGDEDGVAELASEAQLRHVKEVARSEHATPLIGIQSLVGTGPNALPIQIRTALIALLVLKYLQLRACFGWGLSNLATLLRHQLSVYRGLFAWIDAPFQPPPQLAPVPEQIPLLRSTNSIPANLHSSDRMHEGGLPSW